MKATSVNHVDFRETELIWENSYGDWQCVCGNIPIEHGFYPCDSNGNEVEPTQQDWTTDCYVCDRCGRIINMYSLSVVGRRASSSTRQPAK